MLCKLYYNRICALADTDGTGGCRYDDILRYHKWREMAIMTTTDFSVQTYVVNSHCFDDRELSWRN